MPPASEPTMALECSTLRAVTFTSCSASAAPLPVLMRALSPIDALVVDCTTSTATAPATPANRPPAPLAATVNRSSLDVACTSRPFAPAAVPAPPSAFTVAPLPIAACVSLVMLVTPTDAPTPATPRPMPAAPVTMSRDVSSLAWTCTLPPALTAVVPPAIRACVLLFRDTTATDPATPTLPEAARPAPMPSSSSWPRASTSTLRAACSCAFPPTWASTALWPTKTSVPAPTAAAPATDAAPAMPTWNCSLPAATRTDCAAAAAPLPAAKPVSWLICVSLPMVAWVSVLTVATFAPSVMAAAPLPAPDTVVDLMLSWLVAVTARPLTCDCSASAARSLVSAAKTERSVTAAPLASVATNWASATRPSPEMALP